MELSKLKENILNGQLPSQLLIFVCPENYFIADQYIETICNKSGKEKRIIKSIFEQDSAMSLILDYTETINVIKTEIFDEVAEDYSVFENTIVVCNKIDKKLSTVIADYCVEVPKLLDWQLEAYVKQRCPELDKLDIAWLVKAAENNVYKIDNIIDKLCLFSSKNRNEILAKLRFEPGSDLYNIDIFTLCDALIFNNKSVLVDFLRHQYMCNFELLAIVGSLLTKLKNLLFVKYGKKSAADLDINPGYYKRLINTPWISEQRIQELIKVISSIDLQLKSGLLDIPKNRQLDYLMSKICL